jgi:hypothetical protein
MADRNTAAAVTEKNGRSGDRTAVKSDETAKGTSRERDAKDDTPPKAPKKRRKVNHGTFPTPAVQPGQLCRRRPSGRQVSLSPCLLLFLSLVLPRARSHGLDALGL